MRTIAPDQVENDWVSFKDFKDSAPFAGAFFNYTEVPLAKYFSGRLKDMEAACHGIQGHPPAASFSYDLCMQFNALPKIPVLMLFNDADEEFIWAYEAAFSLFETSLDRTKKALSDLLALRPTDPLTNFHLARIADGETSGVIGMKTK